MKNKNQMRRPRCPLCHTEMVRLTIHHRRTFWFCDRWLVGPDHFWWCQDNQGMKKLNSRKGLIKGHPKARNAKDRNVEKVEDLH